MIVLNILGKEIRQKIDYTEYKLLNPDFYRINKIKTILLIL